jgi:glyoxylase-like metal-dependent hydrolase (beta-lactamase superfamily II)
VTLRVRALACGWLTGPRAVFLRDAPGRLRVPVPCFLVEHPSGTVLFDSGLHPALRHDAAGRLGELAGVFACELAPGADAPARLAALGVDPARVRFLVNSHLHFDHAGGNAGIPNARLVVQRAEWSAAHDPDAVRANAYDARDYDLGHDLLLVDGEHDLFGDGRVVCVPTPGHTPGHQSLRVRLDGGDVVLAADACYLRRNLEEGVLPGVVHDEAAFRRSLARLSALRAAGARLVFGHDPEQWAALPQAPAGLAEEEGAWATGSVTT